MKFFMKKMLQCKKDHVALQIRIQEHTVDKF